MLTVNCCLSLPLLVLRILADYAPDHLLLATTAPDHQATIFADRFDGGTNLHKVKSEKLRRCLLALV